MRPLSPQALVALVLAAGVACAMVALAVAAGVAEASHANALSEAAANLLATALGAGIGALATYLGVKQDTSANDPKEDP